MQALRQAAKQALVEYDQHSPLAVVMEELRIALKQPEQEPVAWAHKLIDNIITHRPADIDRHPERWTALYTTPQPCPTCVSLARTVMMDQTGQA